MKKMTKSILAVVAFGFLIVIGNWPGNGVKDEWDNLVKWSKK
ncbi:hypothetical protein [Anaeromicropila herbilytica]|uniref:Uncharacterized protein n=1 Tax=Anaeromicropila herbilytica TaxID=2785025 RepID=A0A7R7EHI8_9FIRM|nr:hypothetical protein [Anaeromicropila herbilytica]BCN28843.1 hypothetical protein bsdtb5_01380 [Anaeromicropila herbilytica]